MAQLRLNKTELRKQKTSLGLYKRYLPTLTLRKQQLYIELNKVRKKQQEKFNQWEEFKATFEDWVVFCALLDTSFDDKLRIEEVQIKTVSIAGVKIPSLQALQIVICDYDLFLEPFWLYPVLLKFKEALQIRWELNILEQQYTLLYHALRVATQRVNLFEKVLIIQAQNDIKKIQVVLSDEEKAAVVRGKIAKSRVKEVKA